MSLRTGILAAAVLAAPALATAADTYKVDPVHSTVIYRVKHMNASYSYGRFNDVAGTFTIDPQDPGKDTFDFTVKTESIDTGNAKREQHLKGPDFFNVQQFPTITFKSTTAKPVDADTAEVQGDLTLHGVTRPVTVHIDHVGTAQGPMGKVAGVEAVFQIKRSDFGMTNMVGPVGDDIRVIVSLEGGSR